MSIRKMIALHPDVKGHVNQPLGDAVHHAMYCAQDVPELRRRLPGREDGHAPVHPGVPRLRRTFATPPPTWACGGPDRTSRVLRETLDLCARACDACAAECEKHDHEHCKLCAQMCRECAEDCRNAALSVMEPA